MLHLRRKSYHINHFWWNQIFYLLTIAKKNTFFQNWSSVLTMYVLNYEDCTVYYFSATRRPFLPSSQGIVGLCSLWIWLAHILKPSFVNWVVVAEWLRRWTRNPLGSPRAGSSPADNAKRLFFCPMPFIFLSVWIVDFSVPTFFVFPFHLDISVPTILDIFFLEIF